MQAADSQIERLKGFTERHKFSTSAWHQRGLQPSSDEMSGFLDRFFNVTANQLSDAVYANAPKRKLTRILKNALSKLNKADYDTEEKEFICSLFYELSVIVGVDIKTTLNTWLYGRFLISLMGIMGILRPEKILEILNQPCEKCATQLETNILKKQNEIPQSSYYVVRCFNCREFNLLSLGSNIKEWEGVNYEFAESLSVNEYTYEQELVRLEQIRFFRK